MPSLSWVQRRSGTGQSIAWNHKQNSILHITVSHKNPLQICRVNTDVSRYVWTDSMRLSKEYHGRTVERFSLGAVESNRYRSILPATLSATTVSQQCSINRGCDKSRLEPRQRSWGNHQVTKDYNFHGVALVLESPKHVERWNAKPPQGLQHGNKRSGSPTSTGPSSWVVTCKIGKTAFSR